MSETLISTNVVATAVSSVQLKMDAVQGFIMHHVKDSHSMMLFPNVSIPLPEYLSLHGLMLVFSAFLLLMAFGLLYKKQAPVPSGFTNLLESFVAFIRNDIVIAYLGPDDGRKMAPLFCSFFFFILTMNLVGLVPCFAAATGNLSVTLAMALISFFFMVFGAMYRTGVLGFFKGFIPHGIPWWVLIVLVPIEMIGLLIKTFALAIRLFANMLSGHIVLFNLLGLVVIFGYFALPSVLMALGIYLLEIFVAFLQAYIFTLLSAIFIGQRYHPEH
ncbi:MAG: F0F1 ATP synthase subunit A [Kiritimatiellae bacterium]|nr:F0F1 ATP synthase subunit A [Kiritimatiellia bacterium]MDD5520786.1 F0F1 ATP synthase subunit A [Kiritimatiellia bacterium]